MAIKFYGGNQLNSKTKVYGTRKDFEVIEVDENGDPITEASTPVTPASEPAPAPAPATAQILPLSRAVSLLMDASATADGSVVDSSTNSHPITVNGDVSQSSFSPYRSGGYSWEFDGNGDYLTSSNENGDFSFGTGDFTVETWAYYKTLPSGNGYPASAWILGGGPYDSNTGFDIAIGSTNIQVGLSSFLTLNINAPHGISAGEWYHIAIVRNGSDLSFYRNGILVVSADVNGVTADDMSTGIAVGAAEPSGAVSGNPNAIYSDFRIVKGTAAYTADFTPPTERLTEVAGTSLLTCNLPYLQSGLTAHGDVSPVAAGPYDYAGYSESLHGGSIVFGNADGNSLSMTGSADFQLDADFTLESWVNITDNGKWQPLAMWGNGHYKAIRIAGRNTSITEINIEYPNTYVFVTHPTPVHGTGWHHIAIVRSGSTITLYVDGVAGNTVTLSNTIGTTEDFKVGYHTTGGGNHWVDGSFADYRLVKGTAVYTTDFTPPTAPLTAVAGTSLLLSGNNASIRDESQTAEKLTVHGSISPVDSSPYDSGKSMGFNGNYITTADGINFSDNDFTIELWWYPTSTGRQGLFHGSYGADWSIGIDYNSTYNNPTIGFWASSTGGSWDIANADPGGNGVTTGEPVQNAWNHIAYVRNGSTLTLYLNGVNVGEVTGVTASIHDKTTTHGMSIGTWWKATGWGGGPMSGNVADYRITKAAVYTENFSVPTATLGDYPPPPVRYYKTLATPYAHIFATYTLTQGRNTVITAPTTDPEGDAITWSYEEVVASVANYVVVSAFQDDDRGSSSGSVYVYDANDLSAQPTKLTAFDGAADDYFGFSVAATTTSNKIIVGAYGDDDNGSMSGSVYVFDANDLSAQPTKLTAFDGAAGDQFGYTVAAAGDKIVISLPFDDDNATNSGSVYVYDANNLSAQPTKLTAFDGAAGDYFGLTVAATSDKIVVSAIFDDDNGATSGSVYVYDANNLSAQPTKLTAFDGAAGDQFGTSVAATADKIVVGARFDDDRGSGSGSIYVFDANDLSAQPTKLTAFDGATNDNFGRPVAASVDKIFVSAQGDDDKGSSSGSVYVYDANDLSAQPTKLTAFDGDEIDLFGYSVAAIDDKIFISAMYDDDNGSKSGSIYVFDANDLSATPTKLTAFDGAANDNFGNSIAAISTSALNGTTVTQSDNVFTVTPAQQDATFTLAFKATDTAGNVTSTTSDFDFTYVNQAPSVAGIDAAYTLTQGQDTVITAVGTDPDGDAVTWSYEEVKSDSYVVVSALYDDDNGTNSGSVYVYDTSDLSAQPTKLTAFDGAVGGQQFGYSVTFSADKIVVGAVGDNDNGNASGSVYVYDANNLSAQPTKLTAFDGAAGDAFGVSVATTSDKIFVGASATDQDGNNSGSVYVYDLNDLSATPTELTAFDGAATEFFGNSIAATSDKFIVGAYGDESNSGAVYVYDANDLSAQPTKLTAYDGAASDFFSYRVAAAADNIVVSAHADDDKGSSSGSVYVYDANDLSASPTKLTAFDGAANDTFGYSIAATSDKIIVGAHQDDDNATNSGSVYVFDANDLSAQPTKLTAFDPIDYHVFGQSVSATDDKIFVGAGQDDDKGSNSGAVYVFDANDLSAQPTKLTAFDGAANDQFGNPVSAFSAQSALNGVTITQSDNVFTVTPGSEATSFSMRFTATDANGNATTTNSLFTVG